MNLAPSTLQHYLSTHLTGAAGATQLVQRLGERLDAANLRELAGELEEEQAQLKRVMDDLDMSPSTATRASARASELISRAARTALGLYDGSLRVLSELEALMTGIAGKQAMWRLLPHLTAAHPALKALDYDRLLAQAERQAQIVESHRLTHGVEALTPSGHPSTALGHPDPTA